MAQKATLGLLVAATLIGASPGWAATHHHRRAYASRHHARYAGHRTGYGYSQPYASSVSPTPTCRYPDGTPFDPDIIGGANHVGDGGPAANLGGFNPCGY